ncbi:pilin N-terminal domain-containing protein [uncultured Peptoniphilus sp.]|uniref:pilin N-terminal domain-containing protein n=1 Tax=uncultured Peptoniphilus sp. TaxID=254354 RepID=UPI00262A2EEC|nr:isopeptide-forming domain-containing fimbrial protein [uncultured Peptoniphilus sp.]
MNKKKIMSLIMALVMLVGVFSPLTALADTRQNEGDPDGISTKADAVTDTVTLHKMLMTKENVKARKVTVNTGTAEKPNMAEEVIVQKDGKYYYAASNQELTTSEPDSKYIAGFASGTPVFPGYSGLDGTKYEGKEIKGLAKYFGSTTQMENVFFAWKFGEGHKGYTDVQKAQGVAEKKYTKNSDIANEEPTDIVAGKYVKADPADKTKPLVLTKTVKGKDVKYLVATDNIEEAMGDYTTTTGIKFTTSELKGAFEIDEVKEKSKYKNDGKTIVDQRAVPVEITLPLVNDKGTVLDAHVYPKNVEDKPVIDKNFVRRHGLAEAIAKGGKTNEILNAGAQYENYQKEKAKVTADVGRVIPYEVKTKVAKGTSYEKLVWKDNMTNGLTYNKDLGTSKTYTGLLVADPNNAKATKDVVTGIKLYKKEVLNTTTNKKEDVEVTLTKGTHYTIKEDDKGFELVFTADGLKEIEKITKPADLNGAAQEAYDVEVVLTYTATVNGSTKVDHPEKNDIQLEYGHKKYEEVKPKEFTPSNETVTIDKSFVEKTTNGDQNLDDKALKELVISFTVYKDGNPFRTVTLDWDTFVNASKRTVNGTEEKYINLGDGVEFIYTNAEEAQAINAFKGKIVGLKNDQGKNNAWSISERVAGFNPVYANTDVAGTVIITNKKDNDNPPPLNPTEPKVVTGGKKFVKTNDREKTDKELKRLLGAQFVVKKEVGEKTYYLVSKADATKTNDQKALLAAEKVYRDAIDAYNEAIKKAAGADTAEKEKNVTIKLPKADKLTSTDTTKDWEDVKGKTNISARIALLRAEYEKAFKTAGTLYDWVEKGTGKAEDIPNVVKISSDFDGRFEIQGLAYGEYKLEEIKTPEGFAKISDQPFTVAEGSYQGARGELKYYPDEAETPDIDAEHGYGQQVKNKEVTIPQTGGIGTVLFTVVGIGLMAGAVMAMKKNREEA